MPDSISSVVGGISQAMPVSFVNAQSKDNSTKSQETAKSQDDANTANAGVGEFRGTAQKVVAQNDGELTRPGKDNSEKDASAKQTSSTEEETVKTLKEYLNNLPSEFEFKFDKEAGRQIMKVVNPVTREVVKQYPPEELLTLAKRLRDMDGNSKENGFLIDDKF